MNSTEENNKEHHRALSDVERLVANGGKIKYGDKTVESESSVMLLMEQDDRFKLILRKHKKVRSGELSALCGLSMMSMNNTARKMIKAGFCTRTLIKTPYCNKQYLYKLV